MAPTSGPAEEGRGASSSQQLPGGGTEHGFGRVPDGSGKSGSGRVTWSTNKEQEFQNSDLQRADGSHREGSLRQAQNKGGGASPAPSTGPKKEKASESSKAATDENTSSGSLSLWWILQDKGDIEQSDFSEGDMDDDMPDSTNAQNEQISKQTMPFLVFHPWSRHRIAWDLLVMVCLVENLILVPFNLAFTETQRDKIDYRGFGGVGVRKFEEQTLESMFWFEFAIDVCFLCDIALNFMTAYVHINEKGDTELVTKRSSIIWQYCKGWFVIDLIGSVPLEFILRFAAQDTSGGLSRVLRIFKLLRLLKLTRVWRLGRFINKLKDAFDFNPAVIRAFKMLIGFCLVAHILTCLLFWVGTVDNVFFTCVPYEETECSEKSCFNQLATCMCDTSNIEARIANLTGGQSLDIRAVDDIQVPCERSTWLREKWFMMPGEFKNGSSNPSIDVTIDDMPIVNQYQITFYWVLATMATVGYGDLKPVTEYEIAVCIVSQIVGATTFGFIVGNMATLADLLKGRAGEFKEQMDNITNLLSFYQVPLSVRRRVTKDFNHQFHKPYAQVKSSIINVIPRALAVQVAKDIFRDILDASPMFKGLPQSVRDQLYLCLQPRHFAPGEVVIRKDVLSSGVYLILSGHIHVSDAQAAGEAITASVKAEDTAVRIEESMKGESKGAGMDAAAVLAEAEATEKFLNEVDESKVLVTLVSGAMMGEECLLPTTLAMPFVAKAAEWLDLLYIDRRDIISLLTDNREALARVHLAARLRNERFRTLLDCTKLIQRMSKTGAASSNNQSFMSPSRRVVPPLKTGDGGSVTDKNMDKGDKAKSGPEGDARAARLRIDPTESFMVGGMRVSDLDLPEVEKMRLAEAINDFSHEIDGVWVTNWSEWMDGKGLAAGLMTLKNKHGSYEMAMQFLDKAQGAASKTKDRHVTLEDLPVLDDEGSFNEKGIESQLLELITRLDRLEKRVTEQHFGLYGAQEGEGDAPPEIVKNDSFTE